MNRTAEKVQVRRDKVCLCLECAEDPTILETEEINILDEPLLMDRLMPTSSVRLILRLLADLKILFFKQMVVKW